MVKTNDDIMHCDHECMCYVYRKSVWQVALKDRPPCSLEIQKAMGYEPCHCDTRAFAIAARQQEPEDPCQSCKYEKQACAFIVDGGLYENACMTKRIWLRLHCREHDAAIARAAREDERKKVLTDKFELIRGVISTDQSGLSEALAKIRILTKGYDWIPAGEWGSYDYTQRTPETLQKECGYLLEAIEKIAYEGLRDSGNRVIAHVRACEESLYSATPAPSVSPEIRNLVDQSFKEYKRDIAPDNRTDSAEQRIADVIATLRQYYLENSPFECDCPEPYEMNGEHCKAVDNCDLCHLDYAISLLKNGVKKDGA